MLSRRASQSAAQRSVVVRSQAGAQRGSVSLTAAAAGPARTALNRFSAGYKSRLMHNALCGIEIFFPCMTHIPSRFRQWVMILSCLI